MRGGVIDAGGGSPRVAPNILLSSSDLSNVLIRFGVGDDISQPRQPLLRSGRKGKLMELGRQSDSRLSLDFERDRKVGLGVLCHICIRTYVGTS